MILPEHKIRRAMSLYWCGGRTLPLKAGGLSRFLNIGDRGEGVPVVSDIM